MDVVVEYSIMPQEYLVPVWNMSNKVQAEIGATKSFVVGFSGGGSSNFMVALSSAAAMLSENDSMKTALLVTGDATIPGNRVLNPADPVTVMGDGASAVVLQRGAPGGVVIDTELWSDGDNHDVCYIPGGSLIHPDDINLYRMQLDKVRYDAFPKAETLRRMSDKLLERAGMKFSDVACVLCSNISAQDEAAMQQAFDGKVSPVCASNRESPRTPARHGFSAQLSFPDREWECKARRVCAWRLSWHGCYGSGDLASLLDRPEPRLTYERNHRHPRSKLLFAPNEEIVVADLRR